MALTYSLNFLPRSFSVLNGNTIKRSICHDVVIIGGGIIGSAIARELKLRHKDLNVLLVEKEDGIGKHQSSHNSGVIHSGLYYKPGTLKAKFCVDGAKKIFKYCEEKRIPYLKCGKLIVANTTCEVETIHELLNRGIENSVKGLALLKKNKEIQKIQPGCKGIQALWSENTANVNWDRVTQCFFDDFTSSGGKTLFNTNILSITKSENADYPIKITYNENDHLNSKYLICCAGLHSDLLKEKIKHNSACKKDQMLSFRVNYLLLEDRKECKKIKTNIYATPNLKMPFLGLHFSPMMNGKVLLGPSAVPAFNVEGYSGDEINLNYVKNFLFSGFPKMVIKHFPTCFSQYSQMTCQETQVKELRKVIEIDGKNITQGFSAVQAQLLTENGSFYDDFIFEIFEGYGNSKRIINCRFLPSPAATGSMSIANFVADRFYKKFDSLSDKKIEVCNV